MIVYDRQYTRQKYVFNLISKIQRKTSLNYHLLLNYYQPPYHTDSEKILQSLMLLHLLVLEQLMLLYVRARRTQLHMLDYVKLRIQRSTVWELSAYNAFQSQVQQTS